MFLNPKSIIAISMAVSPAVADFMVFCGMGVDSMDGAGYNTECKFFNNAPSCDDVNNSQRFTTGNNDASHSGMACDGCDRTIEIKDWDVTRLELNDAGQRQYFEGADTPIHWTIYENRDGALVDTDGNKLGDCEIPDDPQVTDCSIGVARSTLKNVWNCKTDITFNGSPN